MAMASVSVTCSACGEEYTATKKCYNRADAERWELYMSGGEENLCPQCWVAEKKQAETAKRAEQSESHAEEAAKRNWATLIGSEKQVAWAETLRMEAFKLIYYSAGDCTYKSEPITDENADAVANDIIYFFESKTDVRTYIDNRDKTAQQWYDLIGSQSYKDGDQPNSDVFGVVESVSKISKNTVEPEGRKHPGTVEIKTTEASVMAKYERNEAFNALVKSLGYGWDAVNKAWVKKISAYTGSAEDRAAELGNRLLLSGFSIRAECDELRHRAVVAEYEPECRCWVKIVTAGLCLGYFSISWPREFKHFYASTKHLHGAKWVSSSMVVPIEAYKEVEDFAEINGFRLSEGALKAVTAYKESMNPPVVPTAPITPELKDKLSLILESPGEVLDDLKDN